MKSWYLFKNPNRINELRNILYNSSFLSVVDFSKKLGVRLSTGYNYLKIFGDNIKILKSKNRYKIQVLSNQGIIDICNKLLDESRKYFEIHNLVNKKKSEGYTLSEISSYIQKTYGYKISTSYLSHLTKGVERSSEGNSRFSHTLSEYRSKAAKIGFEKNKIKRLIHLKKIQPIITQRAQIVNTRKIINGALSINKVRSFGHILFDGSISNTIKYNAIAYTNVCRFLIDQFVEDMYISYGIKPTEIRLRQDNLWVVRFCSKELVNYMTKLKNSIDSLFEKEEFISYFLRSFWDDEGCVNWAARTDKRGYVHITRQLEGFSKYDTMLSLLNRLHHKLGVYSLIEGHKLVIRGKENLQEFIKKINFSEKVKVCKGITAFKDLSKKELVEFMVLDFNAPKYKIFIRTFGCVANRADTSNLLAPLLKVGYPIVNSENEADVVIYNTCNVKGVTEDNIFNLLSKIPQDKKIVITGCLPILVKSKFDKKINYSALLSASYGNKILSVICRLENRKVIVDLSSNHPSCLIPQNSVNNSVIIISYGCLSNCSYCSTKLARGELRSYSIKDIVKKLKYIIKQDCGTISLTAQDTGAYGLDIGTNLVELLESLIQVPGKFKMRIGMMNPNYAKAMVYKLIEIFKSPKIMKFIHLPVQSGSDAILKEMGRKYSVKDFENVIEALRKDVPEINISTDVICGYPTETEEQFQETMDLIERIRPNVLNITQFFSRPNTSASKLKQLDSRVAKDRTSRLYALFKQLKKTKKN